MHDLIARYRSLIDSKKVPAFCKRWLERKGKRFFKKTFELRHTRLHPYQVRVTDDLKLTLWLDWMDYTDAGYLFLKTWENPTLLLILKTLQPSDNFLDIGANVGYFSLIAAKRCPQGKAIAVEPLARNIEVIRKNIASNEVKNMFLEPVAVAAEAKEMTLKYRFLNSGSPSTHDFFGNDPVVPTYMMEQKVKTKTAAQILSEHSIDYCRLLKIDAQGGEDEILHSLEPLLKERKIGGLIVEYNSAAYGKESLASYLIGLGYQALEILPTGDTKPVAIENLKNKQNYLFQATLN